ncbi:hypothetical protein EAF00_007919 [Botryotinia globosa]|nr:hypothetical protein EAF00_007919 [Botryotinia globosa]
MVCRHAQGTPLQLSKAMHYGKMMSFLQRRGALEVCNLKSVGPLYFHHQVRRHTSTNSLVLSKNEIDMPDPLAFSRRQSVALQSWVTYNLDYHATDSVRLFQEAGMKSMSSELIPNMEKRGKLEGISDKKKDDPSISHSNYTEPSSETGVGSRIPNSYMSYASRPSPRGQWGANPFLPLSQLQSETVGLT